MSRPIAALTADGLKLHLQHGPIDLIITAEGCSNRRREAFAIAEDVMQTVLIDLVAELAILRIPAGSGRAVAGFVASRMVSATSGFGEIFITPMAAVAGAVADHVLSHSMQAGLDRLIVNNGGDIAFGLSAGRSISIGLMGPASDHRLGGTVTINEADDVRGVATSGWRGRSFSLGIADAVTVFAHDAAAADAAASVIASAVDLPGHPSIRREPACALQQDSDLGELLVTVSVGELDAAEQHEAMQHGRVIAERLADGGRIAAALIVLGDQWCAIEGQHGLLGNRLLGPAGLPRG